MKDLFLRFCRWALPLLGVSAAISCDNVINTPDMYGCPPAPEYGVPVMEFRVSGKVTDSETGEPVKGISVTCEEYGDDIAVMTSETGEFVYEEADFPSEKLTMKFTDADPFEDGAYLPTEVEVELVKVQDGDGNWHEGYYIAEGVMVQLDPEPTAEPEYGVPVAEFSVKGRVVDADNNPIKDIEVSTMYWYETVRTAEDGTFLFSGEDIEFEDSSISLLFKDTDGEENGGEFETKTVDVPLELVDAGDGHWDMGDYVAEDVEIVLEQKVK